MTMKAAIPVVIDKWRNSASVFRKINYRIAMPIFGRQRYWGEPFPVYFKTEFQNWWTRMIWPIRFTGDR